MCALQVVACTKDSIIILSNNAAAKIIAMQLHLTVKHLCFADGVMLCDCLLFSGKAYNILAISIYGILMDATPLTSLN